MRNDHFENCLFQRLSVSSFLYQRFHCGWSHDERCHCGWLHDGRCHCGWSHDVRCHCGWSHDERCIIIETGFVIIGTGLVGQLQNLDSGLWTGYHRDRLGYQRDRLGYHWDRLGYHWVLYIIIQMESIQKEIPRYLPEITQLLDTVPRELVLILKTNDLLRGIEFSLSASSYRRSYITMSKSCYKALGHHNIATSGSWRLGMYWWVKMKVALMSICVYEVWLRIQSHLQHY